MNKNQFVFHLLVLILTLLPISSFALEYREVKRGKEFILLEWTKLNIQSLSPYESEASLRLPHLKSHILELQSLYPSLSHTDVLEACLNYFSQFNIPQHVQVVSDALDGKLGSFHPVSTFEAHLLEVHLQSGVEGQREFRAFILHKDQKHKAFQVIGFVPNGAAPSLKASGLATILESHLKAGWQTLADIHNHPFSKIHVYGNSGVLAPSFPDLDAFKLSRENYGTKAAWITNGFETLRNEL